MDNSAVISIRSRTIAVGDTITLGEYVMKAIKVIKGRRSKKRHFRGDLVQWEVSKI